MTTSRSSVYGPMVIAFVSFLLVACGGSATTAGTTGPATYKGATYSTALGDATAKATGCVYTFSASGNISLDIAASGADGTATGTMAIGVVLKSPSPIAGQTCPQKSYTTNQSSNAVGGSYSNLSAQAGDAFNSWKFVGAQSGNTLVGSLTINVTTYDLDGGGSYITLTPVVISGYVLAKQ